MVMETIMIAHERLCDFLSWGGNLLDLMNGNKTELLLPLDSPIPNYHTDGI
jgi:hypothetical protein